MEEKRKNRLFVLIGVPGSGKSTLAANLSRRLPRTRIVSSDGIRKQLYGDENIQGNPKEVFGEVDNQIASSLEHGYDVIYDATNCNRQIQRSIVAKWKGKAHLVAVYLDPGIEVSKKWNKSRSRVVPDEVIDRMHRHLWKPTKEDGWDDILGNK